MAKAKTAAQRAAELVPQPGGGALLPGGQPGNAGGSGRPKEFLRERCRQQIETRKGIEFVGSVMDGTETEDVVTTVRDGKDLLTTVEQVRPKLRDRLLAFELLSDRGYGRPEQGIKLEDAEPRQTGEQIIAEILDMLPRVVALLPVDRKDLAQRLARRRQIEVLVAGKDVTPEGPGNRDAQR